MPNGKVLSAAVMYIRAVAGTAGSLLAVEAGPVPGPADHTSPALSGKANGLLSPALIMTLPNVAEEGGPRSATPGTVISEPRNDAI